MVSKPVSGELRATSHFYSRKTAGLLHQPCSAFHQQGSSGLGRAGFRLEVAFAFVGSEVASDMAARQIEQLVNV
jgi:hypothetical protein